MLADRVEERCQYVCQLTPRWQQGSDPGQRSLCAGAAAACCICAPPQQA